MRCFHKFVFQTNDIVLLRHKEFFESVKVNFAIFAHLSKLPPGWFVVVHVGHNDGDGSLEINGLLVSLHLKFVFSNLFSLSMEFVNVILRHSLYGCVSDIAILLELLLQFLLDHMLSLEYINLSLLTCCVDH